MSKRVAHIHSCDITAVTSLNIKLIPNMKDKISEDLTVNDAEYSVFRQVSCHTESYSS